MGGCHGDHWQGKGSFLHRGVSFASVRGTGGVNGWGAIGRVFNPVARFETLSAIANTLDKSVSDLVVPMGEATR